MAFRTLHLLTIPAVALVPASALAQPVNLLPDPAATITSQPVAADPAPVSAAPVAPQAAPLVEEVAPAHPAVQQWPLPAARALAAIVEGIGEDGLSPADYDLSGLRNALAAGQGAALDEAASKAFRFLVEDLRDGRTPMSGRKQWFVSDPDYERYPTGALMAEAIASGDVAGVLARIVPQHPDYQRLKQLLAATPESDTAKRRLIIANMDRWRWLPRDLGSQYLITNVPEYQLRLTVNDKIIRTYRTVVGKPGSTATPQLAESVEGVIFNPTWTVPQSIVKGEGLGARVLGNPAWARSAGYTASRGANGYVTVVQQPGPTNSLGYMKLDMPNRHAIFLHDTPSRHLFANSARALSHGCIRTERATELAITLAILQGGLTADEGVEKLKSGKYTRVGFDKTMPVYITYFTMAQDIDGELRSFSDIYGRDGAVFEAFARPREANRSRVTDEQIIVLEDDLRDT